MNDNMIVNGDFSTRHFVPWVPRGHLEIVRHGTGYAVHRRMNVPLDDTSTLQQVLDHTGLSPGHISFWMQMWGVATKIPSNVEFLFSTLALSIQYFDPEAGHGFVDTTMRVAVFTKEEKYESWRLDFDIPAQATIEGCFITLSGGESDVAESAECLVGRFVVVPTDPGSTLEWPERH